VKPVVWLGDCLTRLRGFPVEAMHDLGYQLERVQDGDEPKDREVGHRVGPEAFAGVVGREAADMSEKLKMARSSGNVFLDMGSSKVEAENLRLRSQLMRQIDAYYQESGMTQAAAAKALGLTQPRLNALLKGRLSQFSLDALVNIASNAGMNVRLVVKKAA
jgi:predicted XRE-type DNA-binding protein